MKHLALAGLAAAMFAGQLAIAAPAAADDRHGRGHGRYDRHDRDHDDWDDRRDERRAYRHGYREGRHHDRWDDRRHNGYWDGERWYYGRPAHFRDDARSHYGKDNPTQRPRNGREESFTSEVWVLDKPAVGDRPIEVLFCEPAIGVRVGPLQRRQGAIEIHATSEFKVTLDVG